MMICPKCGNKELALISKKDRGYLCDCGCFFSDSDTEIKCEKSCNVSVKAKIENFEKLTAIEIRWIGLDYKFATNGKEQNSDKAFECFELAAKRGDSRAQYYLAMCYEHGEGVAINKEKAVFWLSKSAERGYIRSLLELEENYNDHYMMLIRTKKAKDTPQKNLLKQKLPFCMGIACDKHNVKGKSGSAFILKNGFILSNAHVVTYEQEEVIYEYDNIRAFFDEKVDENKKSYPLVLLFKDVVEDIAILKFMDKVPTHLNNGEGFELGESESAVPLDDVLSIGDPKGFGLIPTEGKVAQKSGFNAQFKQYDEVLQLNMDINSGNSGAPLINMQGQAIGITTFTPTENGIRIAGMGFAVTSKTIKKTIKKYQEERNNVF